MVAREGFVYEQKPLSVTRNVVVREGWSLVRVVVRQGFYCSNFTFLQLDAAMLEMISCGAIFMGNRISRMNSVQFFSTK